MAWKTSREYSVGKYPILFHIIRINRLMLNPDSLYTVFHTIDQTLQQK